MKKTIAVILALATLLLCTGAFGEGAVEPFHALSMDHYGEGSSTVKAQFDPTTAFDSQNRMTYTVLQDDLYLSSQLKALKPGDKIVVLGEESTVETVEEAEDGVEITTNDGIFGFYYADDNKETMYAAEDISPYTTEMGEYTFPLADKVTLRLWVIDADGCQSQEPEVNEVPAGEVEAVFAARNDPAKDDYMDCENSNHIAIHVQDGKIDEITVDWGSDD